MKLSSLLCLSLLLGICSGVGHAVSFKYKRLGNPQDVQVRPEAGPATLKYRRPATLKADRRGPR